MWQVDVRIAAYPPGRIGPKSTFSTNKRYAVQCEATLRELAATGYHEPLDALVAGEITLPELHAAKVSGKLPELLARVHDPPLPESLDTFLLRHPDPRYKTLSDRIRSIAPRNAQVSWLCSINNLRSLVTLYRRQGLSGSTERREMAGMRLFLREQFGAGEASHLMRELGLRRPSKGRTRYLDADEIARLRDEAGAYWWSLIGFAIATGLRRGEILALRVRDVDLRAGTVVVRGGKTPAARRMVPLAGEILRLLEEWISCHGLQSGDRLFEPITTHTLRLAWQRIRQAADLEDVRFHDLRHTYAVHAAKAGMPMVELQQRLGHTNIAMTQRYAVYAPPLASVHYDRALAAMGMADHEPAGQPT